MMSTRGKDRNIFSAFDHFKETVKVGYEKGKERRYFADAKKSLVTLLKRLGKEPPSTQIYTCFRDLQALYDKLVEEECRVALEKFLHDGGNKSDFEMHPTEFDVQFKELSKVLKSTLAVWHRGFQIERRNSLVKGKELLDRLRRLVDGGAIQSSFAVFEEIQSEWRKIADSPPPQFNALRANYHALVDRFYDQRNIYFELRKLDQRKNIEKKIFLCEKAEKLLDMDNIKEAIGELGVIHREFKTIGQVPKEDREAIWLRLKTTSDKLRAKWDNHLKALSEQLNENQRIKEKLLEEITQFDGFSSDNLAEWYEKTRAITELKKKWDKVGAPPRQATGKLNKGFWSVYKHFFHERKKFFKKKDGERVANLQKKEKLLQQAIELKNDPEGKQAAEVFKKLQHEWKAIGPVPEQHARKINSEFRSVGDSFFAQRRSHLEEQHAVLSKNLDKKMLACKEIEKATAAGSTSLEQLTDWIERYNVIGPVPNDKVDKLEARFNRVVTSFFQTLSELDEKKKNLKLFEIKLHGLEDHPKREQKMHYMGQTIRRRIRKQEHDISVFRNNLDFFGRSKGAEKMKNDLIQKLEITLVHQATLKEQLKLLESVL